MSKQLTPWYLGTIKPVRKGFYEIGHSYYVHHRSRHHVTGSRRYWDGKRWCGGWMWTVPSIFGTHPSHQWRGFTTKQP